MRHLSTTFIRNLTDGFLAKLRQAAITDPDLDLQIRDNYLNLYYKGNALLKLTEQNDQRYAVQIDEKFLEDAPVSPFLVDLASVAAFLGQVPRLKQNIIRYGHSSLEIEYEQLIVRANNAEPRNNSDYYILDRQYAIDAARFDLTGFYWDRARRRRGQSVPLCLMEVKFALNPDIKAIHQQLGRYYGLVKANITTLAAEAQSILRQKLELGLFNQPPDRVEAMKTLAISDDIEQVQFVIILIDYNPHSALFDLDGLKALPFAGQIKLFHTGFAMWEQSLTGL